MTRFFDPVTLTLTR